MLKQLESVEQFEELLGNEGKVLLLKHSTTCPISHAAYEEYQEYAGSKPEETSYFLTVQDARALSNHIAEKFQVKHESPQAILFVNNEPVWHASHWKITNKTLNEAVSSK